MLKPTSMLASVLRPELRSFFLAAGQLAGNAAVSVRSVLMVGARTLYHNDEGQRLLAYGDDLYLVKSAFLLAAHGYRVGSDTRIDICNLNYGHDFLDLSLPRRADVVLFCYLRFNPQSPCTWRKGYNDYAGYDNCLLESPHAHKNGAWATGLKASGAFAAVNVHNNRPGDAGELPTNVLQYLPFSLRETSYGVTAWRSGCSADKLTYDLLLAS